MTNYLSGEHRYVITYLTRNLRLISWFKLQFVMHCQVPSRQIGGVKRRLSFRDDSNTWKCFSTHSPQAKNYNNNRAQNKSYFPSLYYYNNDSAQFYEPLYLFLQLEKDFFQGGACCFKGLHQKRHIFIYTDNKKKRPFLVKT